MLEDFYEICWPIRSIGNAVQKVPGQTYEREDGQIVNTSMVWSADAIAFPAIDGHRGASAYELAETLKSYAKSKGIDTAKAGWLDTLLAILGPVIAQLIQKLLEDLLKHESPTPAPAKP